MIYESVSVEEPIKRGDIFVNIPKPRIDSFDSMYSINAHDGTTNKHSWEECSGSSVLLLPVEAVSGIVISQNCDASRDKDISLCQIRQWSEVIKEPFPVTLKKAVSIIKEVDRKRLKIFYLPKSTLFGFSEQKLVDFQTIFSLPRNQLLNHRRLRVGKLNDYASEHFREKISYFFYRHAYDEWYCLNKEELEEYKKDCPDVKGFAWQIDTQIQ
jgi:hypothetical protein